MTTSAEQSRLRNTLDRSRASRKRISTPQTVSLVVFFLISIGIGYMGFQKLAPQQNTTTKIVTSKVQRGTISSTVSLSGSITAVSQAKLTFDSDGRLTDLAVKLGDKVNQGDPLATIDSADLELDVAQAQVSLDQAKLKLTELKKGPTEAEVAAAQASYESALAKYEDLKAGATTAEVTAAEATVRDAEVSLANAEDSLIITEKSTTVSRTPYDRENEHNWYEVNYGDQFKKYQKGEISKEELEKHYQNLMLAKERLDTARAEAKVAMRNAQNEVTQAKETLQKAKDSLAELKAGATTEELKTAEAAMLTAKANLEETSAGNTETDIAAQEVTVRAAEATLKQKQLLLDNATIHAPISGIIDSISANVGEQVTTSSSIITLVNLDHFRIEAKVDESNIAKLKVGQTATISLDALPDANLTAKVTSIGTLATTSQGVVSYPVVVELDPTEESIRPGMTADIIVEVERQDNALLVPGRAIRSQGRTRILQVLVDGQEETRTITTGISNDQYTEIKSGVDEGDIVIIPTTTTTTSTTTSQKTNNNQQNGSNNGLPSGIPGSSQSGGPGGMGR